MSSFKTYSSDPETFVLNYIPPVTGNQPIPRSPASSIYISIDSHRVTFAPSYYRCLVVLVDFENETVVFSDYVDSDGYIEIPTNIIGTYKLILYVNDTTFVGEIEL